MNNQLNSLRFCHAPARSRGMTLLDVILAIVIFVVGMLALASLQGNLTRSSADANAKTVASNIAEELIESLRTIEEINLPAGISCESSLVSMVEQNIYECVADSTTTDFARAGNIFDLSAAVEDWYLMEDGVSVTNNPDDLPEGWSVTASSYKLVDITVNWVGANNERAVGFQGIDPDTTDPLLGSGSVTMTAIIPSIPNLGSAKVAAGQGDVANVPLIDYTPGERPDIVRLDLAGGKFKESTTPKPDVVRSGELSETWFDVITYNQAESGATFLRREEFLIISCECELRAADETAPALMPTIWMGQEYSDDDLRTKPYGVSANNQQSYYCDTCCRDHHDITTSNPDELYDPTRLDNRPSWSENGGDISPADDHAHYKRSNRGEKTLAGVGDTYVEACRMVRKDGFMRVAQDIRQAGFVGFPEGFLDTPTGANDYSLYVTTEVSGLFDSNYDQNGIVNNPTDRLPAPAVGRFPGDSANNATTLPFLGINSQQMRSRGIYVDHLSKSAQDMLECIKALEPYDPAVDDETPGDQCGAPGATSHLQVAPFIELQTTWLAWWEPDPMGDPVTVTNEAVADDNSHSRGYSLLVDTSAVEDVTVNDWIHRGNIGLTATDAITPSDDSLGAQAEGDYSIHVAVNGGGVSVPDTSRYIWEAEFTSAVNRVDVADTVIRPNGDEYCTRTNNMLRCATPNNSAGSITVSGYTKLQGQEFVPLYICIDDPNDPALFTVSGIQANGSYNEATINWTSLNNVNYLDPVISIEESATGCQAN